MSNLKLDSNHDIIIGRGATRVVGVEQVAQLVKCRLLTILGEWELDTNLGLPWFESIFTKNVRPADIEAALANIIRTTNGVRQLVSLDVNPDYRTRQLAVSFVAASVYGDLDEIITWQPSTVLQTKVS